MKRHIAFFFILILSAGICGAQDFLQQNIPIHGPDITRQGGIYDLFTFYDYCCKAEKSTYKSLRIKDFGTDLGRRQLAGRT